MTTTRPATRRFRSGTRPPATGLAAARLAAILLALALPAASGSADSGEPAQLPPLWQAFEPAWVEPSPAEAALPGPVDAAPAPSGVVLGRWAAGGLAVSMLSLGLLLGLAPRAGWARRALAIRPRTRRWRLDPLPRTAAAQPTEPPEAQPTEPPEAQPAEPAEAQPAEPPEAQPAEPAATQPRGTGFPEADPRSAEIERLASALREQQASGAAALARLDALAREVALLRADRDGIRSERLDRLVACVEQLCERLARRESPLAASRPDPAPGPGEPLEPTAGPTDTEPLEPEVEVEVDELADGAVERPPIFEAWRDVQLQTQLGASLDEFLLEQLREPLRPLPAEGRSPRVLWLARRPCERLLRLARSLLDAGLEVEIDCASLEPTAGAALLAVAEAHGLDGSLRFGLAPPWKRRPEAAYDAIVAQDVLDAVSDPGRAVSRLDEALAPAGVLLVVGSTGGSGLPAESAEVVRQIWPSLPERYRTHHPSGRVDGEPALALAASPPRDVLGALGERFSFEVFAAFGSAADAFLGPDYGPNFDLSRDGERRFLEQLSRLDESKIDAGLLKPLHMVAALRRGPVEEPVLFRHWTPAFCRREGDAAR